MARKLGSTPAPATLTAGGCAGRSYRAAVRENVPSWAAMIFNMDQGGDGVNRRGGSTAARRAAGAGGGRSPVQMGSTEPSAGCWAVLCRAADRVYMRVVHSVSLS